MPLSCFFHQDDGTRCNRFTDPEKYFCWRHVIIALREPTKKMMAEAAILFSKNISISSSGQLILLCKDFASWLKFCNLFQALIIKGYSEQEIIEHLSNILSFSQEFLAKLSLASGLRKWKGFEALVARILLSVFTKVRDKETISVCWNASVISKLTNRVRQIDVLIQRLDNGIMKSLEIFQCKDYEGPVSIKEVDAIHSVIQEVGATKGTIVSTNGFQAGAIEKARALQIDLITVRTAISDWVTIEKESNIEQPDIDRIDLIPSSNTEVPRDLGMGRPFEIFFVRPDGKIEHIRDCWTKVINHIAENRCRLPEKYEIKVPFGSIAYNGRGSIGPVKSVVFSVSKAEKTMTRHLDIPPTPIEYVLKNAITEEDSTIQQNKVVPVVVHPSLKKNSFYVNSKGQAYKCLEIDDKLTKLVLIEDVQHGERITVFFTIENIYGSDFFEIEDSEAIGSLEIKGKFAGVK